MWIKFLCWFLGHKTVHKAFTGKQFETVNPLTGFQEPGHYYVWRCSPFCLRCGKASEAQPENGPKEGTINPVIE